MPRIRVEGRACRECSVTGFDAYSNNRGLCVGCCNARSLAWRAANLDRVKQMARVTDKGPKRVAYRREWKWENREHVNAQRRGYYWQDETKSRAYSVAFRRKRREERPVEAWAMAALSSSKRRAAHDGVPHDLDVPWLVANAPEVCPVFGLRIDYKRTSRSDDSPSVDRLRGRYGYIKANTRVVSNRANRLKSDVEDPEVFRRLADWIEREMATPAALREGAER